MEGAWRDRMAIAPAWVFFLGSGVLFGACIYFIGGEPRWLLGAVGAGLLVGACTGIAVAAMRRRDERAAGPKGIPDPVAVARALRTGEVPTDEVLDEPLLGLIERRRRQLGWASRFNPWLFAFLGVSALVGVILNHDAASVVYLVFYLVLFIYLRRGSVRGAERLDRLESAIRSRARD